VAPIRVTIAAQPVLSVAVGYLLLAFAAALFVAAVLLLAAYRRRNDSTPAPSEEPEEEPAPSSRVAPEAMEVPASVSAGFASASDASSSPPWR